MSFPGFQDDSRGLPYICSSSVPVIQYKLCFGLDLFFTLTHVKTVSFGNSDKGIMHRISLSFRDEKGGK